MDPDAPIPLLEKEPGAVPQSIITLPPMVTVTSPSPPMPTKKEKSGWGAIIAMLLIVGLITTAAFYSWGERLATQSAAEKRILE